MKKFLWQIWTIVTFAIIHLGGFMIGANLGLWAVVTSYLIFED